MISNHLILCHPLLFLPSIFPSIKVFTNESALQIRWPKYWSFSFSIHPSSEYSGLISFEIDWFDLLAVQGTLRRAGTVKSFFICTDILSSTKFNCCYYYYLLLLHLFITRTYIKINCGQVLQRGGGANGNLLQYSCL